MVAKRAKKKAKSKKRIVAKAHRTKAAKHTAKTKTAKRTKASARKAKAKRARSREVLGEGNYTATREFDKAQTGFVKKNKRRIPAMGKAAERALEGPEGDDLRHAEEEAKSHSHAHGVEE